MNSLDGLPYRPCVGVLLFNERRLVFVGQRIDMVQEAWQMPQGGIDRGEDPRDTALRELEEETGVTPDKVELVAETREWLRYDLPPNLVNRVWRGRYRGQEQKWFAARFLGTDADIDIDTAASGVQRLALVAGRRAGRECGALQAGALRSGDRRVPPVSFALNRSRRRT